MQPLNAFIRKMPSWAIYLAVGLFAAAINGVVVYLNPPAPRVHDEFSYLLAADTFASGRLTNPTHPHWPHFETMHVIQQPSYASKYQPGQGLLLALGILLGGHALVGVCLSTGLAASATAWMLRVWLSPRWALIGGLLVALHPSVQLRWGRSYWGGALAMAAGALLIGGAARLAKRRPHFAANASAFAIGSVGLAVTRPFEGLILVVGALTIVLTQWVRSAWPTRHELIRSATWATMFGALGLGGVAIYNHAVTGNPFQMPYSIHESTYGATPLFLWEEPRLENEYRHEEIRQYHHASSMWWFDQQQTWNRLLVFKAWLSRCLVEFYLPFPFFLPILVLAWVKRHWALAWLAVALTIWAAGCAAVWLFPHYVAPVGALFVLLVVLGLRAIEIAQRRNSAGRRWIAPTFVSLQALAFAFTASDAVRVPRDTWNYYRASLAEQFMRHPGDDLVIVRYGANHSVYDEWVYNAADIDTAPIVWAREMEAEDNRALIEHFADRNIWLLEPDAQPMRLVPYGKDRSLTITRSGPEGAGLPNATIVAHQDLN